MRSQKSHLRRLTQSTDNCIPNICRMGDLKAKSHSLPVTLHNDKSSNPIIFRIDTPCLNPHSLCYSITERFHKEGQWSEIEHYLTSKTLAWNMMKQILDKHVKPKLENFVKFRKEETNPKNPNQGLLQMDQNRNPTTDAQDSSEGWVILSNAQDPSEDRTAKLERVQQALEENFVRLKHDCGINFILWLITIGVMAVIIAVMMFQTGVMENLGWDAE